MEIPFLIMSFITEFQVVFCSIVLILGFVGNSLVIITFCSKGAKLKAYKALMISLAIADLLGTFCIPLLTILTLKSVDISFLSNFGCQLISWLSTTSLTVSVFSLIAISVHRFMIVFWPLSKRLKPWTIGIIALVSWIMASFVGMIFFFRVKYFPKHNSCRILYKSDSEDIAHTVSMFLIQMVFPVIIMSIMYGIILYRLKAPLAREVSVHSDAIRQGRNRKNTKLFLTVVIVFYVLTLPYNIFYMWYSINRKTIPQENALTIQHIYHLLILILLSNSCVNPLIYARLHASFRRNSFRILCPCLVNQIPSACRWVSCVRDSASSTATPVSSLGAGSPCQSPEPILRSSDQDQSSTPVAENKIDDADFRPFPCDSNGSAMSRGNNNNSTATNSVSVSYLKGEQTVEFQKL